MGGHGPGHRGARRGGVEAEEHHGAHGQAPQGAGLGKSIVIFIIYYIIIIIFMVLFILLLIHLKETRRFTRWLCLGDYFPIG